MLFSPTVSICLQILLSFCSTRALPGRVKSLQAAVQVPSLSGTGATQPFRSETRVLCVSDDLLAVTSSGLCDGGS